jgi:hypothetical protein
MYSSARNCAASASAMFAAVLCAQTAVGQVTPTNVVTTAVPFLRIDKSALNFGGSLGGMLDSGPSVNSSSPFYRGGIDTFGGPYFNIFANVPLTNIGPFAVRAGGMIETMHGTFDFSGTAGGVPTASSGSLWQTDLLATLPFITPINPKLLFSVTPVAGFGLLTPTGNPGGPFFTGNDFAGVVGLDLSLLQPVTPNVVVMYNVGYRHTAPTSFNTTLPGELYKIGASNRVMFSASAFWAQGINIEPNFRW